MTSPYIKTGGHFESPLEIVVYTEKRGQKIPVLIRPEIYNQLQKVFQSLGQQEELEALKIENAHLIFTADRIQIEENGTLKDLKLSQSTVKKVRDTVTTLNHVLGGVNAVDIVVSKERSRAKTAAEELLNKELQFKEQLAQTIHKFTNEQFLKNLELKGYSKKEINSYREKLVALQKIHDPLVQYLKQNLIRQLESGTTVQFAYSEYADKMREIAPQYEKALGDLIVPQKIANGRLPEEPSFSLNLSRLSLHAAFPGGQNVREIKELAETHKTKETYPNFAKLINELYSKQIGYVSNLAIFIEHFKKDRARLEAMMRKEGFSDLDTAAIYNQLPKLYESAKKLEEAFKKIADLSNAQRYEEAMDLYAEFALHQFAPSVEEQKLFFLMSPKALSSDTVKSVLKKFLITAGVEQKRVLQLGESLGGLMKMVTNFSIIYNEALASYEKLEGKKVNEKWKRAGETMGRTLKAFNESLKEDDSQVTSPEAKVLRRWERAVEFEMNPIKKRALKNQLRDVAEKNMPTLGKLKQDIQYFDRLYESLDLYYPWEKGKIAHTVLAVKAKEWDNILGKHGWSRVDLERFDKAYDDYMGAYEELYLAEKRVDGDSENILLQEKFKKVYKTELPEISRAAAEINALGGLEQLKKLDDAVKEYQDVIRSKKTSTKEEIEFLRRGPLDIAEEIKAKNEWMKSLEEFARAPMSWDKGYLDFLKDKDLQKLLKDKGYEISPKTIGQIQTLFSFYQDALKKINRLERRLEENPSDLDARRALSKEVAKMNKDLALIEKGFELHEENIDNLQKAFNEILDYPAYKNRLGSFVFEQIKNFYESNPFQKKKAYLAELSLVRYRPSAASFA